MISAAVPCIGVFIAIRFPRAFTVLLVESISGIKRFLPNIVTAQPSFSALAVTLSIYAFTPE